MPRQLIINPVESKAGFSPKLVDVSYARYLESTLNERWNDHLASTKEYREKQASVPRIIVDEKEFKRNPTPYYYALETSVQMCEEGEIILDVQSEHPYSCVYSGKEQALEHLSMRKDMFMCETDPHSQSLKLNTSLKPSSESSPQILRFDN